MRSTLYALERDMSDMRAKILAIEPTESLLLSSKVAEVESYIDLLKRFDYSALIVSMYASFEEFVEELLCSYCDIIARHDAYSELPEKLTRKNFGHTLAMLKWLKFDPERYPGVSHASLVETLQLCLSGTSPYQLNKHAIAAHGGNLNSEELGKMLGAINLSLEQVCRTDPLVDWHRSRDPHQRIEKVREATVEIGLNDLVGRRNRVAHQGGAPDNILGADKLMELADFVLALSRGVYVSFVSEYLRHPRAVVAQRALLVRHGRPAHKDRVWIVKRPPFRLFLGQPIFALADNFLVRWGRVRSLMVNDVARERVEPDGNGYVGIGFDFRASEGAQLHVLAADDDAVWPALDG